jgi:hypothetical protein
MRANARRQFFNALGRKAAERGIAASVGEIGKGSHFSFALVSNDIDRIPFILSTRQEISPVTYRAMLISIANFLGRDRLSEDQRRFGLAAREVVQDLLEASRGPASVPSGSDSLVLERPRTVATPPHLNPPSADKRSRKTASNHERFFDIVTCYASADLKDRGLQAPETSDLASGMLVLFRNKQPVYPEFQFDHNRNRVWPLVARVLSIFEGQRTPWQAAFWFISANSWLDGAAPRDRLADERDVLSAAIHEVNALVA